MLRELLPGVVGEDCQSLGWFHRTSSTGKEYRKAQEAHPSHLPGTKQGEWQEAGALYLSIQGTGTLWGSAGHLA